MKQPVESPIKSNGDKTDPDSCEHELYAVIAGQRRLILSIICYLFASLLLLLAYMSAEGTQKEPIFNSRFIVFGSLFALTLVLAAILACTGIFRMGKVLFPGSTRYVYAIGTILPLPLFGLLIVIVANAYASGFLKARGVPMGVFGARDDLLIR